MFIYVIMSVILLRTKMSVEIFLILYVTIFATLSSADLQFCSFFNNRAPKAQPSLKNCTWFKENSCCLQQEIEATFGRVKPLQGASLSCQKYMNYLMCYICAPWQNTFYQGERLTVCEDLCDSLYDACKYAILKGSVIGDLYSNGSQFCKSRRFTVATNSCFHFDASWSTNKSHFMIRPNYPLITLLVATAIFMFVDSIFNANRTILKPKQAKSKSSQNTHLLSNIKQCMLLSTEQSISTLSILMVRQSGTAIKKCALFLKTVHIPVIILLFLCHVKHVEPLTHHNNVNEATVKVWSRQISQNFMRFLEEGLHYPEIENLYQQTDYTTEFINGTEKLMQVQEKLSKFFSSKKKMAIRLADDVRALYDDWLKKYTNETLPGRLHDLNSKIYKNADIPDDYLPEDNFIYNKDFNYVISEDHSTVKIPENVAMNSEDVISTVMWTSQLDNIFKRNRLADKDIRWQYFGSKTGVIRLYPGHEWQRNFVGFHEDYDPRLRTWYISAVSGPKDIIIILDGSLSMEKDGGIQRLTAIATNVIGTLTKLDYVSVIVSRSSYWTRSGEQVELSPLSLSCEDLAPASDSHKRKLIAAINTIKPHGGSDHGPAFRYGFNLLQNSSQHNCNSFVIFITDGELFEDREIRCSAGYYKYDEYSRKNYVMGKPCRYDVDVFKRDINAMLDNIQSETVHLFTFLTSPQKHTILPRAPSCSQRYLLSITVSSNDNIFQQMSPYFDMLLNTASAVGSLWTSSYLDASLQRQMITVAVPVTSNVTRQIIGVVGIDVPLETVETLIRHQLWGDVYGFLVTRDEGTAVVHPRIKHSAKLLNDVFDVPISALETHNGKPHGFHKVLHSIAHAQTGDIRITRDAVRAVAVGDDLFWVPMSQSHYFFANIPGSAYSFAFIVGWSDTNYQHARDTMSRDKKHIAYLHRFNLYKNSTLEVRSTMENPLYKGIRINTEQSVVKLAPRSFCNPEVYLKDDLPSFSETHQFLNSFDPNVGCPKGAFQKDIREDVHLTGQLDRLWLARTPKLQRAIRWSYVGTRSGVTRIYPAVTLPHGFDPTSQSWYRRAVVTKDLLSVSTVHKDQRDLSVKLVTLSKAVVSKECTRAHSCSDNPRHCGCPCVRHPDCKSHHCHQGRLCTDGVVQAVVAVDVNYEYFKKLSKVVACDATYMCNGEPCRTRCHLVDDRANLILDQSFSNLTDGVSKSMSLASKYGHIFSVLIKQGVFIQNRRFDYQGVCKDSVQVKVHSTNRVHFSGLHNPSARFPDKRSCIKEVIHYSINRSALAVVGNTISGDLQDDPCANGSFVFTAVAQTNLYLLAVYNYHESTSFVNVNCLIRNRVSAPSSLPVDKTWCVGGKLRVHSPPRQCTSLPPVVCPVSASGPSNQARSKATLVVVSTWLVNRALSPSSVW